MKIAEIAKILTEGPDFGKYNVTSHKCPICDADGKTVMIVPESLYLYNMGALADVVLDDFDLDTRERFISGMCGACWDVLTEGDDDVSDKKQ